MAKLKLDQMSLLSTEQRGAGLIAIALGGALAYCSGLICPEEWQQPAVDQVPRWQLTLAMLRIRLREAPPIDVAMWLVDLSSRVQKSHSTKWYKLPGDFPNDRYKVLTGPQPHQS